jgi:hypothetical protein
MSVETRRAARPLQTSTALGLTIPHSTFPLELVGAERVSVYAGIHFRSSCEDGLVLGRKVGHRAVALYLQPVKK